MTLRGRNRLLMDDKVKGGYTCACGERLDEGNHTPNDECIKIWQDSLQEIEALLKEDTQ